MTYNKKRTIVLIRKSAEKNIRRLPDYIIASFKYWVSLVQLYGIYETKKISVYHDEPLKGKRAGERSIRLSRSYRAIYIISDSLEIEIVEVTEVNKHKY